MKIENIIESMGIDLPLSSPAAALYVPVKQIGNILYVSGQIPTINGVIQYAGKLGGQHSIAYGEAAARLCILNMLAAVKDYVKDLDKIKNVVKLVGFVSSEVGFEDQHIVINAASQLLVDIFGDCGMHARSAVGTSQMPKDVTVEIEGIFEIYP